MPTLEDLPPKIRDILRQLREGLAEMYGDRLRGLVLFGSWARGDAEEESDIDVMVVLDEIEDGAAESSRIMEVVYPLCFEYDELIGVIPMSERDFRERRSPPAHEHSEGGPRRMSPDASSLVEDARSSIEWAQKMVDGGAPRYAASRAYYAMFDLAEAMLMVKGLSYSKHAGVIGGFGREFGKTDPAWRPHHLHLVEAYERRRKGDYGDVGSVSDAEARECVEWAREFLAMAEDWLERNDVPEGDEG